MSTPFRNVKLGPVWEKRRQTQHLNWYWVSNFDQNADWVGQELPFLVSCWEASGSNSNLLCEEIFCTIQNLVTIYLALLEDATGRVTLLLGCGGPSGDGGAVVLGRVNSSH